MSTDAEIKLKAVEEIVVGPEIQIDPHAEAVLRIARKVTEEFKSHPYIKEIFLAAVQAAFGPINVK